MTVDIWGIYYVDPCQHTIPYPKPKLVVVVCVDAKPMGFLINSEIDVWIQIDPQKIICQAQILVSEHPSLDYDSWVDCLSLFPFEESELNRKREPVSPTAKQRILEAVRNSRTVDRKLKKKILKG